MRPVLADGSFRQDLTPSTHMAKASSRQRLELRPLRTTRRRLPRRVARRSRPSPPSIRCSLELDDPYFEKTEDISRDGIIGNYVHGNEPGHHIAYLQCGRTADRTQEQVRMICETMYGPDVNGLCGNDDAGQMSAWYLFSALGFYHRPRLRLV